jgi:hypothetical protein
MQTMKVHKARGREHARKQQQSSKSGGSSRGRGSRAARARGRPERRWQSSTHAHKRQTSGREVVIRPNPADSGGGRLIPVVADLFPAARRRDLDEESGSDLDRTGDSAGGLDGDGGSLDEERKLKIRTSCACGTLTWALIPCQNCATCITWGPKATIYSTGIGANMQETP